MGRNVRNLSVVCPSVPNRDRRAWDLEIETPTGLAKTGGTGLSGLDRCCEEFRKGRSAAALAITEIHDKRHWEERYASFEECVDAEFDLRKASAHRLVSYGHFLGLPSPKSPNGDSVTLLESQARPDHQQAQVGSD